MPHAFKLFPPEGFYADFRENYVKTGKSKYRANYPVLTTASSSLPSPPSCCCPSIFGLLTPQQ